MTIAFATKELNMINAELGRKERIESYSKANPDSVFMQIDENETSFFQSGGVIHNLSMPVGYVHISDRYFKHSPPTYDDIEYAINTIEDEIEKIAPQILNSSSRLVTDSSFIRDIARLSGVESSPKMQLSRRDLEYLFGQYAEIAMGRPPRPDETDTSPQFYAKLLIFREIMHHLKFEDIWILEEPK